MSFEEFVEKVQEKEKFAEKHPDDPSVPHFRDGEDLVPLDSTFLYPGLFVNSEIYIRISEEKYLLFCKNITFSETMEKNLAMIMEGTDSMVYTYEDYADKLADESLTRFMETGDTLPEF